jgi:hypothetical protein
MPLTIDRVAVSMDVVSDEPGSSSSRPLTDVELRDRLRPVVLEILNAELERLRREQG